LNAENLLLLIVATPGALFLLLGLAWLLGGHLPERAIARLSTVAYSLLTAAVAVLGWQLLQAPSHAVQISLGNWFTVGNYGFPLVFLADQISFPLIAITVVLVGLIASFSVRYLHRDPGFPRFFLLLHLFALGALLVFASRSIDLLIAGWELVGVTSVLLIGFFQYRPDPVRNALRVFGTYRVADLFILLAVFLAHHWFGGGSWDALLDGTLISGDSATQTKALVLALLLVFAASGKSAQGIFSGWLPRAMEGPTPSSAVFYGAISVHAGAYLLLRAEPLIQSSPWSRGLVLVIGLSTALVSTLVHRTCADAKTSLAYASQTQLGIIFAEIGLGWSNVALVHVIGHAIVRAMQFLRAPSMLHDYHRVHSAAGGHLDPTGEHLETVLPKGLQMALYRIAIGRGYYDPLVDRFVIAPMKSLARLLALFEPRWVRPPAPVPAPLAQADRGTRIPVADEVRTTPQI
jgi:NADH:ubiquinone oxidoreductase subunit 5 (subunit L)/multisubunit Na+/H+ antiporter MnhA subunit